MALAYLLGYTVVHEFSAQRCVCGGRGGGVAAHRSENSPGITWYFPSGDDGSQEPLS